MIRHLLVFILLSISVSAAFVGQTTASIHNLNGIDFQKTIRMAKDRVFPSVVFINAIVNDYQTGKKSYVNTYGSGVIISDEGEVLTNWHVINNAIELRCMLQDGSTYKATIIGSDKDVDIALIQLDHHNVAVSFPAAELGDSSSLIEGDFVMAMGAPWGLSRTLSLGIISCTNRFLENKSEYSLWLQTDASISPGNSGGPLVSTSGQVVGINTRGINSGGDIGFAVPSNTIKKLLPRIRKFKKVNWSWTGLSLQPLNDFRHNIHFNETGGGVIVAGTEPESPAQMTGILIKDRITAINGEPITALTSEALPPLRAKLGMLPHGKPVRITIERGGDLQDFVIVPQEKGKVEGKEYVCSNWGFSVKAINRFETPNLYFHTKKGVFVYGLKPLGNAEIAGLRPNDIIDRVNGVKINGLEELKQANESFNNGLGKSPRVNISLLRNGLPHQVVIESTID
jgi:S1-C subfamily serine protease